MATISGPVGWAPEPVIVSLVGYSTISLGNVVFCQPSATDGQGISSCLSMSAARARRVGAVFGIALEAGVSGDTIKVQLKGKVSANLVETLGYGIESGGELIPDIDHGGGQGLCAYEEGVDGATTIKRAPILGISLELVGTTGTGDETTAALYEILFDGINKFGTVEPEG